MVYGMPRAAVELGVVDRILPLNQIPQALVNAVTASPHGKNPPPSPNPGHTPTQADTIKS